MEYIIEVKTPEVLLEMIEKHNEEYRMGNPSISDSKYDAMVEMLREMDPHNDWFKKLEPSPVLSGRKVSLPVPMKSLNKIKDISEFKKWHLSLGLGKNANVVCMPKFDGLSLLRNERTGAAYSRGGIENEGQDCTEHYKECVGCFNPPSNFQYTFGEFIINRDRWNEYFQGQNSKLTGEPFKSARNTASGLLNRDEPCEYLKYASFFRYGVDEASLSGYSKFSSLIRGICSLYQQEHMYRLCPIGEVDESMLMEMYKEWSKLYQIDGIVIYVDDLNVWDSIGRHQSSGNPLYAVAYKHPDFTDSFETTVKEVNWKVSKAGAFKPVVNIDEVDTGDCSMKNPTGYNAGWISSMRIAPGAKVLVTRSGGVIPKILQTLTPASMSDIEKQWDELAECPHCGSHTAWNESYVELCCTNPKCPGIQLAKIIFFFNVCGVEEMGEETFAKIYDAGFTTVSSILNITAPQLLKIDGFGEGVSNIVLENMKKIKKGVSMSTMMHASDCFCGIGKIKAQKILDELEDADLMSFYLGTWRVPEGLEDSEEFKKKSKTYMSFILGIEPFYEFCSNLDIPIVDQEKSSINHNGKCAGVSVCFSGVRDNDLEDYIRNEGGTVVSGVSKNTTHLIVKDADGSSSKISKAKMLGIPIMSIETFKSYY